ncbi:hypothetical protein NliqN6_6129 [Naganishia liquefaciens]|uniref:Translin n=1 Tax=Naganishia liquefaciens TaxID=104408 RepID=A0A8H3YJ21_9TREE|nr:hypothetical protein NliqN6_6129 [Naganishia liquefaciens]
MSMSKTATASSVLPTQDLTTAPPLNRHAALRTVFESFRATLDDQNERRERIIVSSRQVTALSKKVIFHLLRISLIPRAAPDRDEQRRQTLAEADAKVDEILDWLRKCRDDLVEANVSFWAYARNISPGIQEFIEAVSLLHYLRHSALITREELHERLRESEENSKPIVPISAEDYALGVSDLTGELMRYATNCSSTGDYEAALHACAFVRDMKAGLDTSQPFVRDLKKKQDVTDASLQKIEKICYAIQLKILEYGDRPEVLERFAKRALEESEEAARDGGDAGGEEGQRGGEGGRGRGSGRGGRGGPRGRGRGRGGALGQESTRERDEGPPKKKVMTETSSEAVAKSSE